MWLLVAREPRPDAPDWPGRRMLAAVDAVVWPLLWVLLIQHAPDSRATGASGSASAAFAEVLPVANAASSSTPARRISAARPLPPARARKDRARSG